MLAINLWHINFITADVTAVFSHDDSILTKSLYLMGYTAKRLTDEYREENWTKHSVNKLLKSCRTQKQLTGGQAAADLAMPTMKKTFRQLMI